MSQNDNGNFNIVITFVVVLGTMYGIWHFFEGPIISLLRWVKLGELHLVAVFTDRFDAVIRALPQMSVEPHAEKLQPRDLDAATYWNISAALGGIMRWPTALGLVGCLGWIWFHSPGAKFKNQYDLEGLMRIQAKSWPAISPVLDFNPGQGSARVQGDPVPAELPLFAEALAPDEWVTWARIPMHEGVPDKEGIRQAFITQLGPRWEDLTGLKPYHRALLAAFALKGAQQRRESDELLGQIAQCWQPRGDAKSGWREGGLTLAEPVKARVDKILADQALLEPVLSQAASHAYRTTALLGALRWAREQGGVLAPAQFLWMRGQDRALWYALNNLGRRSFHTEGAGGMAHFMAERAAGANAKGGRERGLIMPRVETAIQPVLDYVQEQVKNGRPLPMLQTKPLRRTAATAKPSAKPSFKPSFIKRLKSARA